METEERALRRRGDASFRVGLIAGCLDPREGGTVRSVAGHAVTLGYSGTPATVFGVAGTGGIDDIEELGLGGHCVRVWAGPGAELELLRSFSEELPHLDLVHLNGHWNELNYAAAERCRDFRVPYVVSSRFQWSDAWMRTVRDERIERLLDRERELLAGALAVHVTSYFELKASRFPVQPTRVLTVPNQMDLRHLDTSATQNETRQRLGIEADEFAILHFGRVSPEKNIPFLLDVLAAMEDLQGWRLHVVGDGSPGHRDELNRQAARLGIGHRVLFHGYVGGSARSDWLRAADLFVLSSFGESFCRSLVEAVASGTPSLISPFVGAAEFLQDTPIRVAPLEVSAWVREIETMAACRTSLGEPCVAKLSHRFSSVEVGRAWRAFYADLPNRADDRTPPFCNWLARVVGPRATDTLSAIHGGASARRFYRFASDRYGSVVAMHVVERQSEYLATEAPSSEELPFCRIGEVFAAQGWPVPRILAYDPSVEAVLVEDCGDERLFDAIQSASIDRAAALYHDATSLLVHLQSRSEEVRRSSPLISSRRLDSDTLRWELWHFVAWCIELRIGHPLCGADRRRVGRVLTRIAERLCEGPEVVVHRDFHAQNIMVRANGDLVVLDYQDAALGNTVYDAASLLVDNCRELDDRFVHARVGELHRGLVAEGVVRESREDFLLRFQLQALQRCLKIAGRFSYLQRMTGVDQTEMVEFALSTARRYAARFPEVDELLTFLDRLARSHDVAVGVDSGQEEAA